MPTGERVQARLSPALAAMGPSRRAILLHLRGRTEAGAEEIATALGITAGAARQQLRALVAEGLLAHRDLRPGPGRPRRRYRLTPAAHALFPQAYGDLAVEILGHVATEDEDLLQRAFERRRRARVEAARTRLHGKDFSGRVAELSRVLDEQGYMATARRDDDGSFTVTEHHCAILAVARNHRCACDTELAFLREALPDAEIHRVSHIVGGDRTCSYVIRPHREGE